MRSVTLSFVLITGLLATGACSKKQVDTAQAPPSEITPEAASPNDSPATVTMTDGSRYHGALISKNGSQMTFRGDNGATRTLDSRDIQSIRFGDVVTPPTNHKKPALSERSSAPNASLPTPDRRPEPMPKGDHSE